MHFHPDKLPQVKTAGDTSVHKLSALCLLPLIFATGSQQESYSLKEREREKKKRTQGLRTLGRRGCVSPGRLYMHIWFYHFMLLRFLTREIHSGQPCLLSSEGRKQRWEVCLSRRLKHSDKIQNRTISKVTPRHIKSLERYRGPESFLHCLPAIGTAVTPEPPRYRQVTITKTLIEFNFMSVTVCFPASPGASLL